MTGKLADRWGGEEGYEPYVFSYEVHGQDQEMREKIRAFTYDAGVIMTFLRKGILYSPEYDAKALPIKVNGNFTNLCRVEINGRQYLVEISPLNY